MTKTLLVGTLALALVGAMGFVFGNGASAAPEDCTPACGSAESCVCRCDTTGVACEPANSVCGNACMCGCEDTP
jgi:hypothetical protein